MQSCDEQTLSCDACISICVVELFDLALDNDSSLDSRARGDILQYLHGLVVMEYCTIKMADFGHISSYVV